MEDLGGGFLDPPSGFDFYRCPPVRPARCRDGRAFRDAGRFFPSSIHGNIEMLIAPMIDPLSRANTPNPSSELQVPDTTASLRRAIPGKIGETRSPSLAVAAQYVFVIAAICSRPTSGSGWR